LLLVQTFLLALWAKIVNIANYLTNYLLLKWIVGSPPTNNFLCHL
jgi:hypothetical protein